MVLYVFLGISKNYSVTEQEIGIPQLFLPCCVDILKSVCNVNHGTDFMRMYIPVLCIGR